MKFSFDTFKLATTSIRTLEVDNWDQFVEFLRAYSTQIGLPAHKTSGNFMWIGAFVLKPMNQRIEKKGRASPNIDYMSEFIAIDIDENGWNSDNIQNKIGYWTHVRHTTTFSRADKQRWRLIFNTSRTCNQQDFRTVWLFLNLMFNNQFDPGTKDAPRISYVPAKWIGADNIFETNDGEKLDIDWVLKEMATLSTISGLSLSTNKLKSTPMGYTSKKKLDGIPSPIDQNFKMITPTIIQSALAKPSMRFYNLLVGVASRYKRNGWELLDVDLAREALIILPNEKDGSPRLNALGEAQKAIGFAEANVKTKMIIRKINTNKF